MLQPRWSICFRTWISRSVFYSEIGRNRFHCSCDSCFDFSTNVKSNDDFTQHDAMISPSKWNIMFAFTSDFASAFTLVAKSSRATESDVKSNVKCFHTSKKAISAWLKMWNFISFHKTVNLGRRPNAISENSWWHILDSGT